MEITSVVWYNHNFSEVTFGDSSTETVSIIAITEYISFLADALAAEEEGSEAYTNIESQISNRQTVLATILATPGRPE